MQLSLRAQNLLAALLLIVFVAVGWPAREKFQVASGDEATYLALSHSIEAGEYREIWRAGTPRHVQYPPAYPVWLIVVRHLTGERIALIPAFNLALTALSLAIIFGVARRIQPGWLAPALLLLLVLSHGMLWIGGAYYSEALFLFLCSCALAATLGTEEAEPRSAYPALVLAMLAFLTRSAGIAIVVGVGAWIWKRRRGVEMAVFTVSALLVVGGWFGYAKTAGEHQPTRSYSKDFISGGAHTVRGLAVDLGKRVAGNAVTYGTQGLPVELSMPSIPGTQLDNWLWLILNIGCLSTGLRFLWRRWRPTATFLVVYALILLAWPWPVGRLMEPAVPFILLTFLLGAWRLAARLPPRAGVFALAGLVAVLLFGAVQGAAARVAHYSACDRAHPYAGGGCYELKTRSLVAASAYLARHAAPGDVVLSWRITSVHFLSGRRGVSATLVDRVPPGTIADTMRARGIRYALLTGIDRYETGPLAAALQASCQQFRIEARFAAGTLLLTPAAPIETARDTSSAACEAIAAFRRENPEEPWRQR